MSWWRDILRQSVFMCIFIVLIPIGAYTIHSGSSAIVAVVSYLFLSLVVPTAYVGAADAVFGREQGRIRRWAVVLVWLLLLALTAAVKVYLGEYWKAAPFWEWPTIGRDLVFIVAMYVEISLIMLVSYVISSWMPIRKDVG